MNRHFKKTNPGAIAQAASSPRRGSTILLVLAMLSILLLLGIAFSYSTRLESQASFNYAELAQARTAAATGLPMAMPMLVDASQGITTTLQNWNTVPQALQKMSRADGKSANMSPAETAALRQAGIGTQQSSSGEVTGGPQANIQMRDLSGLLNLNAIEDQAAMQRVVNAILPETDSVKKSAALMTLRGDAPVTNPSGRGFRADDAPADLDPRKPNAQMLDNLVRLRIDLVSGQPLFSEPEIQKLSKFVTVFSQAPEVFNGNKGTHVPKIPLDFIDTKHVYDTLRLAFPEKNNELLLQFAANVADFSDEDNEPTVLDSSGNSVSSTMGGEPGSNVTIGVEMTPFISEVYPDSATSVAFDDDGQFVELVNPWNRAINLSGWTLRTGSGATIQLTAQLPPGGYLVITDNYDKPKPDSPPGHGSLVSLFGTTADGSANQVMTQPTLDLTDRNSRVSLYNPDGELADVFAYTTTGQVDGKVSFQRPDPMVRGDITAQATAFAPASSGAGNSEARAAATKAWENGNTTMTKVSQLFALSTGFVEKNPEAAISGGEKVHASQMAELQMPENFDASSKTAADPFPDNLDLRLIDVFTATRFHEDTALTDNSTSTTRNDQRGGRASSGKSASQAFRDKMERLRERNQNNSANSRNNSKEDEKSTVPTVYSYGKLNLNTCAKYALVGLNLNGAAQAGTAQGATAAMIEQFEGYRLRQAQQGSAPFVNVSEFITGFVPGMNRNNLAQLDSIVDQVTVGSSAFELVSTNRLTQKEQDALESNDSTSGPRPATATARWIISTDQEPYSVVGFTLVP